ncbi:MAG TPA: TlpA disulfide reductase family protein, partial [Atopobiaceae bacterium]|nr:TlpA disulfide reductase family protein [Atopobiaceae bacterium]
MRKIGPLAALIALVVVLALGFAGYALLGSQHEEPSKDSEQLEQPEQSGQADDSEQSSDEDPIMLADYDARIYTEQGDMIALSEIADGKPLVINFWATWCPYCVQELPDF